MALQAALCRAARAPCAMRCVYAERILRHERDARVIAYVDALRCYADALTLFRARCCFAMPLDFRMPLMLTLPPYAKRIMLPYGCHTLRDATSAISSIPLADAAAPLPPSRLFSCRCHADAFLSAADAISPPLPLRYALMLFCHATLYMPPMPYADFAPLRHGEMSFRRLLSSFTLRIHTSQWTM